jgi:hypothetical protein
VNDTPTAAPIAEIGRRVVDILKKHWDEEPTQ